MSDSKSSERTVRLEDVGIEQLYRRAGDKQHLALHPGGYLEEQAIRYVETQIEQYEFTKLYEDINIIDINIGE